MEFHIIFQNETKMWHENRRECTATFTRTTPGSPTWLTPRGNPLAHIMNASMGHCIQSLLSIFTLLFDLAQHECHVKRKELEKIRDDLLQLANALKGENLGMTNINDVEIDDN